MAEMSMAKQCMDTNRYHAFAPLSVWHTFASWAWVKASSVSGKMSSVRHTLPIVRWKWHVTDTMCSAYEATAPPVGGKNNGSCNCLDCYN